MTGVHRGLERLALGPELAKLFAIGVAHHRHDEAGLEGDRDTDVDLLRRHGRVPVDARPQAWVRAQRLRGRGDDHVGVRRVRCLAPSVRVRHEAEVLNKSLKSCEGLV